MKDLPKAPIIPHKTEEHGNVRIDNYHWIRDDKWKDIVAGTIEFANPKVKEYIDAENEYTKSVMEDTKELQEELYKDLLSRVKEDDASFPIKKNDYYYYRKTVKGLDYPLYCRKYQDLDNEAEVYFDVNKEAKASGTELYKLGYHETNDTERYLAYTVNTTGSMEYSIKVRDLETSKDLDWEIKNTNGEFLWKDDVHFYFCERNESGRGKKVYKVNIHQGLDSKELLFDKPPEYDAMYMELAVTNNKKHMQILLHSGSRQVIYKETQKGFQKYLEGTDDIHYEVEHHEGYFYILTNEEAEKGKLVRVGENIDSPREESYELIIPEENERDISDMHLYNDYLVLFFRNHKKALDEIEVYNIKTKERKPVDIPEEVYDVYCTGSYDYKDTKIIVQLDSPISPNKILELDIIEAKFKELTQKEIPNYNPNNYEVKREFAQARDGEEIPLTIIHKKGIELDSSHKAYVYAYGSYGLSMETDFDANLFTMVDRGFVYCIPHIRGGQEKGHQWYLNGKMHKKMNTFNDYIDSCEHLINKGYTTKGEIVANGGSAGGLLMGVVSNLRPNLFKCVIADVAFVDMINTILDDSMPLTPSEWEEWGNPIASKEDYEYMLSYSPYDNIEKKDYPHMLYTSGISDEQVTYWEPTKMVAKLREYKTDDNILLLDMKMSSGHSGASKRYQKYRDYAFKYAFVFKCFDR